MQGQKRFSPELFFRVSLENSVPQHHVLGQFGSLIALDYLHEETRRYYSHTGQLDSNDSLVKHGAIGRHYDGQADVSKMGRRRQQCFVNSQRSPTTDPDASVVFRKGRGRQAAFKGHIAVDGDRRVITAVEVSSGSADDTTAVDPLLRGHLSQLGGRPQHVVVDSHYGTSEVYGHLTGQDIEAVIRPRRTNYRPGFLTADDFNYDREKDCYICPQGEVLKLKGYQRTVHGKGYVADKNACDPCPLRATCTTSRQHGRLITRFIDDHFERADRLVQSERGQRLLRRRQTVVEGVFGEAKSFHLLQRALCRGKVKLKIQLLLTAAVLNLQRLLRWQPRRTVASALPKVVSKFITLRAAIIRILFVYSAPALES